MKKLLTASALTALFAFGAAAGPASASSASLSTDDAEEIIADMADYEMESGDLEDYEITDSEQVSRRTVHVYIDTEETNGDFCSSEMTLKLKSSNRVSVRRTDIECDSDE